MIQELKNARPYIITNLVNWIKENYPNRTSEYDKCNRDLGMIIDAIAYDLENNTSSETSYIANKFWSRGKPMLNDHTVELHVYDMLLVEISQLFSPALWSEDYSDQISAFIDNLKTTIVNGPVYQKNSWDGIVNNRIMTFNWTTDIPQESDIEKIMLELHEFVPSKQRRVRYNINIIRNYENEQRKNMIYAGTEAEPGNPKSRYNPQVLAPWLIAFSQRPEGNEGVAEKYYQLETWLDIGLASNFVSLSALTKNFDVGFCQCIQNRKEIQEQLGFTPILYLGLGYRDPSTTYFCPVKNKIVNIPNDPLTKPQLSKYTRWI